MVCRKRICMLYGVDMRTITTIDCKNCHPRHHGIFCELSTDELSYLNQHKVTKIYPKQVVIFHEGEKPRGLYCLFSGLVKIYKTSSDGKDQIVRLAQGGDVLGYRSFFSGEMYAASAQAIEEVTVCYIDQEGINKLIERSPSVLFNLLKKVCVELREAEEKFQSLMGKSVEERLAYFMTMFVPKDKKQEVHLPLSREEIASLIGARPETVIRALSDWKDQGII